MTPAVDAALDALSDAVAANIGAGWTVVDATVSKLPAQQVADLAAGDAVTERVGMGDAWRHTVDVDVTIDGATEAGSDASTTARASRSARDGNRRLRSSPIRKSAPRSIARTRGGRMVSPRMRPTKDASPGSGRRRASAGYDGCIVSARGRRPAPGCRRDGDARRLPRAPGREAT